MSIAGDYPLGFVGLNAVVGSTVSLTLPVPANTPPAPYEITALSADSTGALVSSEPDIIDVEREDIPTSSKVDPPSVTMGFVGDTLPLTIRAIDVDVILEGSKFLNLFTI